MHINITGHHVEISSSLREYVMTKFTKLATHFDHINNVHIVLTVEKSQQSAEATIYLKGNELFASANNEDMYKAIDALTDKLDKQVLKYKGKISNH